MAVLHRAKAAGKTEAMFRVWNDAIRANLADNNIRLRLRTILPSLFEKVVFDTTARTVEGIVRQGVSLPNALVNGPILLPPAGKGMEVIIEDGKMAVVLK
jgi:hypothetical protein